jgi:hypothetical protein
MRYWDAQRILGQLRTRLPPLQSTPHVILDPSHPTFQKCVRLTGGFLGGTPLLHTSLKKKTTAAKWNDFTQAEAASQHIRASPPSKMECTCYWYILCQVEETLNSPIRRFISNSCSLDLARSYLTL